MHGIWLCKAQGMTTTIFLLAHSTSPSPLRDVGSVSVVTRGPVVIKGCLLLADGSPDAGEE